MLEDSCSDALQHMFLGLPLKDNAVNAMQVEHMRKQEPCWSATNNGHLGAKSL
jgi:hypothetical protein